MASQRNIKKNQKKLKNLIERTKDPLVSRIAYSMMTAITWATERTVGWDDMDREAIAEADILRDELKQYNGK